jgi:AAA domain
VLAGEAAERGRTPVLIIDEAHLLDHGQLESIRMLTNHDMDSRTPFATILPGQPTLRRMIKLGVLAALDQRIAVRYQMTGMTPGRDRQLRPPPPADRRPRRRPVPRRRHRRGHRDRMSARRHHEQQTPPGAPRAGFLLSRTRASSMTAPRSP